MSGLKKNDDDSLDDIDSLVSMIKGTKKNKEAKIPEESADILQTSTTSKPTNTPGAGISSSESQDIVFSDAADLPGKDTQQEVSPAGTGKEITGKDVRESLGKLLANAETNQPQASTQHSGKTEKQPAIEIINEDPKAAVRSKSVKVATPAASVENDVVTEADKGIVNVDQISEISGLILPKGVSFKIDELQLHGRISSFEGTGTLPQDFDEIWKKNFSTAGFKDLDIGSDADIDKIKAKTEPKKFGLGSLFKAIHTTLEEYDPKKHGPLVDVTFKTQPGIEEIEIYPVNPPYAYIQIVYDHTTHEYTYVVLEPQS